MVVAALARRIFGSPSDRRVKRFQPQVDAINALEPQFQKLTDEELRSKTAEFRAELDKGRSLDDILVPAFGTVREASRRVLGMRHFDVQLIGGMVLNNRAIAEMRTGEGKTLVATLAVYLNALNGRGVHVVTVNDYLARRDAEWMGQIYRFLGLTVGVIVHGLTDEERKEAYAADVTYGTNNEFGFDYLRDNMKYSREQMVQRGHAFAIVDEVDSILIDEARTPLIISGQSQDRSNLYVQIDQMMSIIGEGDFEKDEKQRNVTYTDQGIEKLEERLAADGLLKGASLFDVENIALVHHLNSALRAHKMFQKDKDYIVRNDEVVIIDEFTGRMMPGRRYSEGLHQALEAKEHAKIQPENQTLASITFQNYFRLYEKLAGMTGTASTEAAEFEDIYKLEVITIPTNLPVRRADEDDEVFRTAQEKFDAVIGEIEAAHERLQPVLVGTASIEKSEVFAEMLKKKGFTQIDFADPRGLDQLYAAARSGKPSRNFAVLNARFHEQEAFIVAEAGVPGAITIATNMAGRGTDIKLGGNQEMRLATETAGIEDEAVRKAKASEIAEEIERFRQVVLNSGAKGAPGGLYIVGTERHESRRIDNQLRGRSGRQGDPGRSKFYLSLQDDLMRIFPVESMDTMLSRLGLEQGEAITHPWVTKAIEKAQGRVEARNFDIRKNILKYDDVMNDQRKVIFEQRLELMDAENVTETVNEMRHDLVEQLIADAIPARSYPEQWDMDRLRESLRNFLNIDLDIKGWTEEEGIDSEVVRERLIQATDQAAQAREEQITATLARMGQDDPEAMRRVEKSIVLQSIDNLWREHLVMLDHLSKVVGWRGMAQRDPLNEYKQEAFELFQTLLNNLREMVTQQLSRVQIVAPEPKPAPDLSQISEIHVDPLTGENDAEPEADPRLVARAAMSAAAAGTPASVAGAQALKPIDPELLKGVSRNAPCPCGSGKKFKHCHGAF